MSEIDDAAEFVANAIPESSFEEALGKALQRGATPSGGGSGKKAKAGKLCQYGLYKGGYTPTVATVENLPPGCYNITADSNHIFCTPALPPSGLLLELPEMRSDEVLHVVDTFWKSEKDYKEGNEFVIGGAAYKAGLMLYGPPGSGKSCTIKLLTKKLLERDGTIFYADSSPELVESFLSQFATVEPDRKCIVIFEDFDSLINRFGEAHYLQILDSAKTINNVLFIATTNYPDRLDPRIYNRPGRFSHVIKIGLPTPAARKAYLEAVLKDHRDVAYIVENSEGFTVDHLSALLNGVYREKKNLADEIKRLRVLFKVPKAEDSKHIGIAKS